MNILWNFHLGSTEYIHQMQLALWEHRALLFLQTGWDSQNVRPSHPHGRSDAFVLKELGKRILENFPLIHRVSVPREREWGKAQQLRLSIWSILAKRQSYYSVKEKRDRLLRGESRGLFPLQSRFISLDVSRFIDLHLFLPWPLQVLG